jgi:predicted DNA-binding transcriptional regulator AlpA
MLKTLDTVNTLPQVAYRCGLSFTTLRRLLAAGKGPKTTQLSARRVGVRESHLLEWLDSRVRNGDAAEESQGHASAQGDEATV